MLRAAPSTSRALLNLRIVSARRTTQRLYSSNNDNDNNGNDNSNKNDEDGRSPSQGQTYREQQARRDEERARGEQESAQREQWEKARRAIIQGSVPVNSSDAGNDSQDSRIKPLDPRLIRKTSADGSAPKGIYRPFLGNRDPNAPAAREFRPVETPTHQPAGPTPIVRGSSASSSTTDSTEAPPKPTGIVRPSSSTTDSTNAPPKPTGIVRPYTRKLDEDKLKDAEVIRPKLYRYPSGTGGADYNPDKPPPMRTVLYTLDERDIVTRPSPTQPVEDRDSTTESTSGSVPPTGRTPDGTLRRVTEWPQRTAEYLQQRAEFSRDEDSGKTSDNAEPAKISPIVRPKMSNVPESKVKFIPPILHVYQSNSSAEEMRKGRIRGPPVVSTLRDTSGLVRERREISERKWGLNRFMKAKLGKPLKKEKPKRTQERIYNPADFIRPTASIVPFRRDPLPVPSDFEPLGRKKEDLHATHSLKSLITSKLPIQIYVSNSINAYHNLALEHHLFTHLDPDKTHLFIYRNDRAVVIGRNQNPWLEANHPLLIPDPNAPSHYPDGKPIPTPLPPPVLLRRRSGGGAVLHDLGNVNYSVTVPTSVFSRQKHAEMIAQTCRNLGVHTAKVNDRHDIVMDSAITIKGEDDFTPVPENHWDLKISGSAFKLTKDRSYHHGTMLCTTDLNAMRFLRSPLRDLNCVKARGVDSVPAEVENTNIQPEDFILEVVKSFKELYKGQKFGVCLVKENEPYKEVGFREEVEVMKSQDWIYGQTPRFWLTLPAKKGVVEVDKGIIVSEDMKGSHFGGRVIEWLIERSGVEGGKEWAKHAVGAVEWGKWEGMKGWAKEERRRIAQIWKEVEEEKRRPQKIARKRQMIERYAVPAHKKAKRTSWEQRGSAKKWR